MRRAWLLALLCAPAIAAAQIVIPPPADGKINFENVSQSSVDDFINIAECTGGFTIRLRADIARTATGNIAQYQLFASNTSGDESVDKTGSCIESPTGNNTNFRVGGVDTPRTAIINGETIDATYDPSLIASVAGKSCEGTGADEDIILCIKGMSSGGADLGWARGKLRLSRTRPATPTISRVGPGEQALTVDWSAPNPGVLETYEAQASTDPSFSATATVFSSGRVVGTRARIEDLQNFVEYSVRVFAFSDADNPSLEPSNVVTGIPVPVNDFFEYYDVLGGVEQGGCGSGAAGLIALAGVAALLVFRRRS